MKLKDYVEMLTALVPEHGEMEVAISQEGYYAGSPLADLHLPPFLEEVQLSSDKYGWIDTELNGRTCQKYGVVKPAVYKTFLMLGNSEQNY